MRKILPGMIRVTYTSDNGRVLFDSDLTVKQATKFVKDLGETLGSTAK